MRMFVRVTHLGTGSYRATCPSLPGCLACDRSAEEAVHGIHRAICMYLASLDVALPDRLELQVASNGEVDPRPQAAGARTPRSLQQLTVT